jgi:hypothetical protein
MMEDDMPDGSMPEIEMVVNDDADAGMTPEAAQTFLLRRFVWDITPCPDVNDLLTALGLTHGSEEGQAIDHRDSHARLGQVYPLELILQVYSGIMSRVVTTAMSEAAGITEDVDMEAFAVQECNVILSATRAIIAQLMDVKLLTYGPNSPMLQMGPGVPGL